MRLVKDFKSNGMWVQSKTLDGVRVITTAGRLWGAILTRTKVRGSFCKHHPNTQQASNLFNDFQEFAERAKTALIVISKILITKEKN